jgi:hypothetical protein
MIKSIGKLTLATILAAVIVGVPLAGSAQSTASTNAPATVPKPHPSTFRPTKIAAVDKVAKTISLDDKAKHVLEVGSESKIFIDKKPATFDDVAMGQMASGSYMKTADGKLMLKTLNIHAAPTAAPAPK